MSKMGVDFEAGIKLLVLLVTTDCNLRCRYCYANGGDAPVYMDYHYQLCGGSCPAQVYSQSGKLQGVRPVESSATAAFIDYISKNRGRMVNALAN